MSTPKYYNPYERDPPKLYPMFFSEKLSLGSTVESSELRALGWGGWGQAQGLELRVQGSEATTLNPRPQAL